MNILSSNKNERTTKPVPSFTKTQFYWINLNNYSLLSRSSVVGWFSLIVDCTVLGVSTVAVSPSESESNEKIEARTVGMTFLGSSEKFLNA